MAQVLFDRLKSNLAQCINDGTIYFVKDSNGNFTQIALGDGSKSHVVGIGPKMDDATKQELMSKLGLTISSDMRTIQLGKLANHNGVSSQKVVTYERTGLGTDIHEISTVGYVQQHMKTAKTMVYAGIFNAQTKEITDYNNAIISPSEEGNVTFDYLLNGNEGETMLTPGMSFIVGTAGNLEGYTGISVYGGETKVEVGDMIIIINVQPKESVEGGSMYNEASILIIQNTNLKISDGAITTAKLADGAVTASKLSTDIQSLISNLSKTATFAGIATPTTNPGTPEGPVFYIATIAGSYSNFSNIEVLKGETVILQWNSSTWTKSSFKPMTDFNSVFDADGKTITLKNEEQDKKLSVLDGTVNGVQANFISGKYLNASYQEIDDNDYCISDYIEASKDNRVIWTYGLGRIKGKIVIYNSAKEPITYYSTSTIDTETKNMSLPDVGTAYVRISFGKNVEGAGAIIRDVNDSITIREWFPVAGVVGLKEEVNNLSTRITNAEGNIERNTERITNLENKYASLNSINSVSNNSSLAYLYRKEIAEQYTEYMASQTSDIDDSYIDNRLDSIPDGKHIIFFTDYHYQSNSHQSIAMMEYVKARLGGDVKVLFGGDYTGREDTKQSGLSIMRKFSRMCKNAFGAENFLPCIGDHDTNLTNRTADLQQYALSYKDLHTYIGDIGGKANFEYRDAELESFVSVEDMQEMKDWMKLHYYVDSENEKIRFIVLAVAYPEYPELLKKYFGNPDYVNFAPYRVLVALQAEWIHDVMMSTPEGWDVVMLAHKIAYGAGQTKTGTEDWTLMNMTGACVQLAKLFKTKSNSNIYNYLPAEDLVIGSSIDRFKTFLSDGRNHVFDFTNAPNIRHMVVLCGYNHWDSVTILRNGGNTGFVNGGKISSISYTNGDIPIICSTCDNNKRRNQPLDTNHSSSVDRIYADNTLDSVAFDVITLTDDKIYCTRFGHTECEPADYWLANPELASRERHIEGAADRMIEFVG